MVGQSPKGSTLGLYWAFVVADIKVFLRSPTALFFTLFFPLMFMLIFGYLNLGDNPTYDYSSYLVPGVVGMGLMQTAVLGVVTVLVRFKSQFVLRRIRATNSGPVPILVSQLVSNLVVNLVAAVLLFGTASLLFDEFRDILFSQSFVSWAYLLLFIIFGAASFLSLGLLISARLRDDRTALPIANVSTLPMLFFAGVFFPTDVIPEWLQPYAELLPLSFLVDGMRGLLLRGAGIEELGLDLLGLSVWGVVLFALAVVGFKWE